jgi:predicted secreted protein
MRKTLALGVSCVAIVISLGAAPGCSTHLTAADNGKTVELKVGQTVVISLGGNPSIPDSAWSMDKLDGQSVEQVGEVRYENWSGRPVPGGMSCDFTFTFRAVRAGKSVIRLGRYDSDKPEFTVTLDVKGEPASKPATAPSRIDLTAADNGKTVQVTFGQTAVISLGGNPSVGFVWSMDKLDGQSVEQVGEVQFVMEEPAMPGKSGNYIFTFRAVGAGKSVVRLGDYLRSWKKDRPPVKEFTVTFDVKG